MGEEKLDHANIKKEWARAHLVNALCFDEFSDRPIVRNHGVSIRILLNTYSHHGIKAERRDVATSENMELILENAPDCLDHLSNLRIRTFNST